MNLLSTFFRTIWTDDPAPGDGVAYLNALLEEFNLTVIPAEADSDQEPNDGITESDYSEFD